MKRLALAGSVFLSAAVGLGSGCSSNGGNGGTGSGGTTGSGGSSAGSGGSGAGTGGTPSGTGGTSAGTGGASASGGASGTGGASSGTGGSSSGTGGSAPGTGGSSGDGGAAETGGGGTTMSFFVTSVGAGMGGNLGGLAGADAKCKMLATAVSAELGAKNWKAYLSTSTENARDRIGKGPWRNAKGVVIATSLEQLHEEGGMMNMIRPAPGMPSNALDEKGGVVPMGGGSNGVHDILTGSTALGMKDPMDRHCSNWTAITGSAFAGHHDRQGGAVTGNAQGAWNAVHDVGCAPVGAGGRTVASGGGRGSIYCFAAD